MAKCMMYLIQLVMTQIPEIDRDETMCSNCRTKLLRSVPIQKCLIVANLKIEVYTNLTSAMQSIRQALSSYRTEHKVIQFLIRNGSRIVPPSRIRRNTKK